MSENNRRESGMVPLAVGDSVVELYWMDTGLLEDETQFACAYQSLSRSRREKVDSFLYRKDKKLSLGAGLLLRQGLAARGIDEREAVLAYGVHGKPCLPEYPDIYFNLSHSGEMAIAVFADSAVGCDVELVECADMAIAEKFFSKNEYQYLAGFSDKRQQDEAFYRLWTLKESFVKATGAGLTLPLNAFEIVILADEGREKNGCARVCQRVDTAAYAFGEYRFGRYCAAVCLRGGQGR